jgi:hypothetical protein
MNDPREKQSQAQPEAAPPAPAAASDQKSGEKKELTAEEQMALYEENLKETDWGHQPC